ncbi:hypothetical protein PCE31107_02929 [Pandoraea cepalis]|uniref:Uncharacterized protein n=2 Tax=Pandoraea TaxID=93217 RepID=A0A5E4XEC1_9BURK|nr:hypothetical protein PCE31107_02929 [Pandoraea cepalis]VVE34468.1 hypothetical protein PTE31013_03850 [Pandoraea terrigena]
MRRKNSSHKTVHHHHYYGGRRRLRVRILRTLVATVVLFLAYKSAVHVLAGSGSHLYHY